MKLNLGCGPVHPSSWVNVDGSNRAWLASQLPWLNHFLVAVRLLPPTEFSTKTVYANLLRRFPWDGNTVDAVYLGEMLEHFTKEDGERVLRECYRVLKPGGLLRIRVPDQVNFWRNYLQEYEQKKQQPRDGWTLAHTRWTAMYFQDLCVRRPRIWASMGHYHKWMYDEISLILLAEAVGFKQVNRRIFRQSGISLIEEVEARDDLIIEGTRP